MAQVLTSVIQTTGPHTMPYSPSDAYKSTPAQSSSSSATTTTTAQQQQSRSLQMPRTQHSANSGPTGYRGTAATAAAAAPIAPYAFSSTPQLRQETKSTSAPSPQVVQQQLPTPATQTRLGHPSHPSSSSDSTVSTSGSSSRSLAGPSAAAKDDAHAKKVADSIAPSITLSSTNLDLSFSVGESPVKPSPGRYRRAPGRTDSSNSVPTGSTTPAQRSTSEGNVQTAPSLPTLNANSDVAASPQPSRPLHNRASSADDTQVTRTGGMDAAKRYRRRSFNGLDGDIINPSKASLHVTPATGQSAPLSQSATRPSSSGRTASRPPSSQSHERQGSIGSASSNNSSPSQSRPALNPQRSYASVAGGSSAKASESNRRQAPSPLSHPISPSESPAQTKPDPASSAAMQQLSAVNDKDKGMKSRLRRAFSFGSAAELRRASAENNISAERAKLRKGQYQNDEDAEQAAIIAKQEAAGIGAGIYSGQGGIGSTDNLSIQSAASSASVMLRKMGHGMKKGTKSIKGLFRPKSVIGVPAADGPIKPSVGQVSLVTVEAERHKVNVNAHPHEQTRGGTGYPRLERNSIDAGQTAEIVDPSVPGSDTAPRKSIVGSDRDRAEVLSSMKKGILKRTGTNSESGSPVIRPEDSSRSSSPATPKTEAGPARSDDYFTKPPRIHNGSTMSLPTTPHNGIRNISFSPRIQFHDAWSPQDYDRRGDIATCNRLTPMLAQQIKEELNSFKMEMEVHELSKPHTHFF